MTRAHDIVMRACRDQVAISPCSFAVRSILLSDNSVTRPFIRFSQNFKIVRADTVGIIHNFR